ncbi:alpha/beta hydrolase family esterase [Chitinophaga arvensicola]|uniref:Poly(3-hydroxybutyrate) depolymerase n=1 Tax=Chitinophaga arvensicola TaxID=29529 RepID=A0A1I0S751_9BACT|nr:hypothetical protein [Chitinophaga arvensicola]SEW51568.1 Poly(3-hydroxybutyrate) depolymerase [Chitinophaga arvensicola]
MKNILIWLCAGILLTGCTKRKNDLDGIPDITPVEKPVPAVKTGLHKDSIMVNYADGKRGYRYFLYYMPSALTTARPVSLVFNFHGAINYTGPDPMPDSLMHIYENDFLNQVADTANFIAVFPVGLKSGTEANWQDSARNVQFVKGMLAFFETAKPEIDKNRIYACGHSSGAIFSFRLALAMSDVFAAVCPVSGQYTLANFGTAPARIVPVRCFNGILDATVNFGAAVQNIRAWADKVGGYYVKDSTRNLDSISIRNNKYTAYPTVWEGGNGNIEMYAIKQAGHGIHWGTILPLMWGFMRDNPLNKQQGLYLGVEKDMVNYVAGSSYQVQVRASGNASLEILTVPSGFTATLNGRTINIKAGGKPKAGVLVVKAVSGNLSKLAEVRFEKE